MASKFLQRIGKRIQQVASEQILYHLNDPRIGFVTVTKVEVLQDLSVATVYVSVFGDESAVRKTMRALQSAAGHVQRVVAKSLHTRTAPHLRFEYDESIARGIEIENLIARARASDPDGGLGDGVDDQTGNDVDLVVESDSPDNIESPNAAE